jgi:hypothetical protein
MPLPERCRKPLTPFVRRRAMGHAAACALLEALPHPRRPLPPPLVKGFITLKP